MTNSEQVKQEIDALGLQTGVDTIPVAIPIVETNPKLVKACNIVRQAGGTANTTIYTTPTTEDFFVVGYCLSHSKDVLSTAATAVIRTIIDGANRDIAKISGITLTADSQTITGAFVHPLKIDKNTAISLVFDAAGATHRGDATIVGFTLPVTSN
jgi:hypothetical protein